jgi:hypothetical protein
VSAVKLTFREPSDVAIGVSTDMEAGSSENVDIGYGKESLFSSFLILDGSIVDMASAVDGMSFNRGFGTVSEIDGRRSRADDEAGRSNRDGIKCSVFIRTFRFGWEATEVVALALCVSDDDIKTVGGWGCLARAPSPLV